MFQRAPGQGTQSRNTHAPTPSPDREIQKDLELRRDGPEMIELVGRADRVGPREFVLGCPETVIYQHNDNPAEPDKTIFNGAGPRML